MDRSGPPTPYSTPSEPVSTLSTQPSAAEPPPDFAFRFPCSAYSECWPFVAVQRDGPNGLDRADILLLGKDEAGENISMRTEPLSLKLKRTALTSAEPCRRPEAWHPRCSHHAKRSDALELGRAVDRVAQRERSNGLDQADILLLAKDEAGENVLHAACTYGNISEWQLNPEISNRNTD